MRPAASSARETYIEIANFVNMRRRAYISRLRALSIFISDMVKYKQIQCPTKNRDMLHREQIFFPDESSGVFDSHSSAPRRGVLCADNIVFHVAVT